MQDLPDNSAIIRVGRTERIVKNLRMRRSILLVSQAFMGGTPPGVTHVALGSGIGAGTLALPEAPNDQATSLRKEFFRQPIDSITYDDLTNEIGDTYSDGTRSNRLLISNQIGSADCANLVTEIGLFGGVNQQDMIAWVTFPVIDNRAGGQTPGAPEALTFNWALSFPFVQPESEA